MSEVQHLLLLLLLIESVDISPVLNYAAYTRFVVREKRSITILLEMFKYIERVSQLVKIFQLLMTRQYFFFVQPRKKRQKRHEIVK